MADRIQSIPAERAVLGSILQSPSAYDRVAGIIKGPDYFGPAGHQTIFMAMQAIREMGDPIDMLTVKNYLHTEGTLAQLHVGNDSPYTGAAYVTDLTDRVPDVANVERYAVIVRDHWIARLAVETFRSGLAEVEAGKRSITTVIASSVDRLLRHVDVSASGLTSIDKVMRHDVVPEIERRMTDSDHFRGIHTFSPSLDAIFHGWQEEQLYLICAMTSAGKTAFSQNAILAGLDAHKDLQVVKYSLEMSRFALGTRFLSMESGVELELIRSAYLSEEQIALVHEAAARLAEKKNRLFLNTRRVSMEDIVAECRMLSKQFTSYRRLVVVDYIQLLRSGGLRQQERNDLMLRNVARGLLDLGKELGCPVITFAQLNDDAMERPPEYRPLARDLRDAKALRDDARGCILLNRPWVHQKKNKAYKECYLKLVVDKHSEGPAGDDVVIHYDTKTQIMREIDEDPDCLICANHVGPPFPPPRPPGQRGKKKKSAAAKEVQAALALAGLAEEDK